MHPNIVYADRYVADVATRNKFYEEAVRTWELYGSKVGDTGAVEAVQGLVGARTVIQALLSVGVSGSSYLTCGRPELREFE